MLIRMIYFHTFWFKNNWIYRTKHVAGGNLHTSMSGSCGVCVDGVLYLFGGHHARGNTNRVQYVLIFNTVTYSEMHYVDMFVLIILQSFCILSLPYRSTVYPWELPAWFGRKWGTSKDSLHPPRTSWVAGFRRTGEGFAWCASGKWHHTNEC